MAPYIPALILLANLAHPVLTVNWMDSPVIDGEISPAEWTDAAGVGGFMEMGGVQSSMASCRIGADARGLVLLWTMPDAPEAKQRDRDGQLWQDDAMEFFVQPEGSPQYYQVIVNAAGDIADFEGRGGSWNAGVEAAVGSRDDRGWFVEMRVPWADLGGEPEPGEVWRMNFARDIAGGTPLTWAPIEGTLHQPDRFGELRFSKQPVSAGVERLRRKTDDLLLIDAEVEEATFHATLLDEDGEVARKDATESQTLQVSLPEPGRYLLRMQAGVNNETIFSQEVPVVRRAPLELTIREALLEADRVRVQMDASTGGVTPDSYSVQIGDIDPLHVQPGDQALQAEVSVDIAGLEHGTVPVVARALRNGEAIARAEDSFEYPPAPKWLGSDIGVSEAVPSPWTPVRISDDTVRVWGREYDFSQGPLLNTLTTRKSQVLAKPMRLVTVADGRHQFWRDAQLQWANCSEAAAEGNITAQADAATLDCDIYCEFDGMVRFDLQITPKNNVPLQEVVLEIPLREEHARYLHAADANWGGSVSTALPDEGWAHPFMPFVWLGDERRGVQWFAESDQGWRPRDPDEAITIGTRNGVTTLRLRMVEEPLKPGEAFATTFGIQATPVRDISPQHREWHITHGAFYGMADRAVSSTGYAEYPAEGNVSFQRGAVEMRVSPLFDPSIEVERSARAQFNRELLRIEQDDGDYLGFYWNIDDRSMRLYTRVDGDVRLFAGGGRQEPWEQGSWHHVAASWGDGSAAVWVDGEKIASTPWDAPVLPGDVKDARVVLGSTGSATASEFAVDEFRISDIPREYEQPPAHDLPADSHTLLLDGFESETQQAGVAQERTLEGQGIAFQDGVIGRAVQFGAPDRTLTLMEHLKNLGVNTLVIHERWTEIQAYGSTREHQQQLRDLVEACHAHDIRILVYFGYQLSNIAPEWDLYRDEILVRPRRGGYERGDYPQTAYICCFKSPWKEYYLESIAHMIDEYDIDGVYLDGTTEPFGCTNAFHGCGYVGEDGERHRTYPVWAVRDLMKRMRHVVKSRKPDGLISAHMSATVSIPTLSFVDSYWDGEQLDVHEHGFRLPLDAFRAEFMGHNWGVPAEFLCYHNRPFTYEEAVPLALLHDVPVRPTTRGRLLEMMSRVWAAWDVIDIERAEWFPYWSKDGPISAHNDDVLVSTHVGAEGSLVAAMNASDTDRTVRLNVPTQWTTARELIQDHQYTVHDGELSIEMPAWKGAVLLVQ